MKKNAWWHLPNLGQDGRSVTFVREENNQVNRSFDKAFLLRGEKVHKIHHILWLQASIIVLSLMFFGNGNSNPGNSAHADEGVVPAQVEQSLPVEGQAGFRSGWFNIVWGDGLEGETEMIYTLTDDYGQKTRLFIDEALSRSVGGVLHFDRKRVNVEGVWATLLLPEGAVTGLKVTALSLAPSPEAGALSSDVSPAVTGSKPWISIMCKFNDYAVEPENLTFFTGMYSNTYPRLDHYWRELSYDTANVAGSSASGWFTLPQPLSYYNPTLSAGGANLDLLVADCTAAADATVNFASYKDGGINMMFNADFDFGWAWGGGHYMTLDGVTQTWRTTWEPPWAYADISVIQHEMGHGFGLPHSSGAYGATYDNVWDVMSQDRYNCAAATDATYGCIAQHTISYHKDKLGWIPPAQKFTAAVGSTTTITLERLALPATLNYKMAQIPIGGSSTFFYTVEARQLNGYDSKLPGAAVIIHEVDTTRLVPAQVVDFDLNGDTSDAGAMWVAGETFVDTVNDISVRVDSATATGFQVTIANNPYTGGGEKGLELGQPFPLTQAWEGDKVFKPKVAYNSKHREYLVVYHWSNKTLFPFFNRQIHGARISEDGKYIANYVISEIFSNDCASPDVAYDPVNDRYLVVWMWDKNGDGSNWDLRGRFVTREGPDPSKSSFPVSELVDYDEFYPRLVYGEAQKDFLVVTTLFRNDGSPVYPYIIGYRIKADGSGMPNGGIQDFSIFNTGQYRINATVAYNSIRDEYLVVYDNTADVLAQRIRGLDAGLTGTQISVAGWPDPEDRPEVAFSRLKNIYVVTWDSKRSSGLGEVYGRFVNGDGSLSTVFRLDDDIGGVRPDFTSAVACKQSTDQCLAYWIAVHNNTYYTFGRQLHAGGTLEGGFPFTNLNTVASWASFGEDPQTAIAGGSRNYFMAYKNNAWGSAISIWGQPTLFKSFPWPMFLPAITNKAQP